MRRGLLWSMCLSLYLLQIVELISKIYFRIHHQIWMVCIVQLRCYFLKAQNNWFFHELGVWSRIFEYCFFLWRSNGDGIPFDLCVRPCGNIPPPGPRAWPLSNKKVFTLPHRLGLTCVQLYWTREIKYCLFFSDKNFYWLWKRVVTECSHLKCCPRFRLFMDFDDG